jgi:hypothetical protein
VPRCKDFSKKSKADPSSFWKSIWSQEQAFIFCNSEIEFLQHSISANDTQAGFDPVRALNPVPSPGP